MPTIPLGIGAYRRGVLPEVVLRNLILEKDKSGLSPDETLRVSRPGLFDLADLGAPIRALHYSPPRDARIAVAGSSVYRGPTALGTLPGFGPVPVTTTPFASFLVAEGQLFVMDDTLESVALPDDAPRDGYVQDVDQLKGYALALLPNGRFYWVEPGETEVDPLHYATAESLPDDAVAIRRLGDEFWIFGTSTVEVWQLTGDPVQPFQYASGRSFERGCLHRDAVRRFDNTLVWIGDDHQVYRASSVPQVISDPGVSERIRLTSGRCTAWTFGMDGHSYYVLNIPDQGTMVYDASVQTWSEFTTGDSASWAAWTGYQANGGVVAGSATDGRIWTVSGEALDDAGTPVEKVATGTVPIRGKPPRNDSVSIGVAASDDCTIRLRWRDGQEPYPEYYDGLEVRARFDVAQMWRLGQPDQPYRTFEVSCVDPIKLSIAGMVANEGWA